MEGNFRLSRAGRPSQPTRPTEAVSAGSCKATRQAKRKARDARVFALKPLPGAFGYAARLMPVDKRPNLHSSRIIT